MDGRVKTEWSEIGLELRRHGWTATKVAAHMNLPRSTVRRWFEHNAEPGFHAGQQLLSLHRRVCQSVAARITPAWRSENCM